jgi:hypothetical protein
MNGNNIAMLSATLQDLTRSNPLLCKELICLAELIVPEKLADNKIEQTIMT